MFLKLHDVWDLAKCGSKSFQFIVVRASLKSIRELRGTKSRSETIKTELWESRKHEGIVMKSIRNKRKVLERGKAVERTEEWRTVFCV